MILEHRGAVEAFLKAASIAEGRQPARKIMRRVLFYRADLHGAVTTASAGDLSAATFHSLRLADDLVMMMHVQDAILDGASSRHAACASHALSLLETLCVIAPSKVAGPFHRMAMHTLETHGSSGRLHECRGGRSQEEGGAGEREELTGLLNLSSSLHTRRTAAGSLGALLAAPDVERHTKPGLRRTLLLLVADHDPSVACRAALALSGEISALRGSGAAARQISGARKAWLRGEAWASLSEALR